MDNEEGTIQLVPVLSTWAPEALERLKRRASGDEKPIATGWANIDRALGGGLWPGMHVLVGLTGTAKTQWALQLAWHVSRSVIPVLYFGLELDRVSCAARILGISQSTAWSEILRGTDRRLLDDPRLQNILSNKAPLRVWFPEEGPLKEDAFTDLAKTFRLKYREPVPKDQPLLVVVDYLQMIGSNDSSADTRQRIRSFSITANILARALNIAILLVSSTPRDSYDKIEHKGANDDPRRLVGTGKEAGEIEYSADTVLVLCPASGEPRIEPSKSIRRVSLALSKVRAGEPCWIQLDFVNGSYFEDNDMPFVSVNGQDAGDKGRGPSRKRRSQDIRISPEDARRL